MSAPLSYALSLATRGFTAPMGVAKGALSGFKSVASGTVGVLTRVVAPLAALTSGAALAATAFKSLSVASDMEQTTVGLSSLIGSMKETKKLLGEVKTLSASTPFEFPELAKSTRSLIAMDVAVDKIPSTLKRIGDVASGVQAPISELSLLYGRAKNDGVLYTETLNQLNDRGIPVFTELGKIMGKSNVEIKKMASDGKITFPLLEQSFINLTKEGGKFHGMMAAQSETNAGLLSTLKDGFTDLMLTVGTPINDALKPILKDAIGLVKRVGLGLSGVVDIAKAAIAQGRLGELLSIGLQIGLKEAANYGVSTFIFMGEMLFKSLHFAFKQSVTLFTGGFNESFKNIATGLVQVLAGLGQMILSKLGSPFRTVAAYFQAGLAKAINFLLAELGSTKLGEFLGIHVEHQDFDDLLAESKKAMDPSSLMGQGKKNIDEGIGTMGKGFGDLFKKNFEIAKEVLKGTKFEKINLFDLKKDKAAMKELSETLSPEGLAKVMQAMEGSSQGLSDAATKTQKATASAAGLSNALAKANAPKAEKEKKDKEDKQKNGGRKRSRLYSAAESLSRRFSRQSGADKGTFSDFIKGSHGNRSTVRDFAKKNNISFSKALAQLQRGSTAAGKQRPGKKGAARDTQTPIDTLGVLKRIDGRLDNLALA